MRLYYSNFSDQAIIDRFIQGLTLAMERYQLKIKTIEEESGFLNFGRAKRNIEGRNADAKMITGRLVTTMSAYIGLSPSFIYAGAGAVLFELPYGKPVHLNKLLQPVDIALDNDYYSKHHQSLVNERFLHAVDQAKDKYGIRYSDIERGSAVKNFNDTRYKLQNNNNRVVSGKHVLRTCAYLGVSPSYVYSGQWPILYELEFGRPAALERKRIAPVQDDALDRIIDE